MAAVSRGRPTLRDVAIPKRQPAADDLAVLRGATPHRRYRGERRQPGVTVAVSFSVLPLHDQIVDFWSGRWDVPRSEVARKALALADLAWRKEGR